MQSQVQFLVLLLQLLEISSEVYYIKSSDDFSCPSEPCLTLEQFVQSTSEHVTAGTTLVFLPGRHSLQSSVNLSDISGITLRGTGQNSTPTTILCNNQYNFVWRNISNVHVKSLAFDLTENQWHVGDGAVFRMMRCRHVVIQNCTFQGSGSIRQSTSIALVAVSSDVNITRSHFQGITGRNGGAISVSLGTYLILSENFFVRNEAVNNGGAVYIDQFCGVLLSPHNRFSHNSASSGGAIYCNDSTIDISGSNLFDNNYSLYNGGAIFAFYAILSTLSGGVTFHHNEASHGSGGAIFLDFSTVTFDGHAIIFSRNVARLSGGGMSLRGSDVKGNASLELIANRAGFLGGGIDIASSAQSFLSTFTYPVEVTGNFTENMAKCGGAVAISGGINVTFTNTVMIGNYESALCISRSNVTFMGKTLLSDNSGATGGGIDSKESYVKFRDYTTFDGNSATIGGAINSNQGEVSLNGLTWFLGNTVDKEGGAIYAVRTNIIMRCNCTFEENLALRGGAIYLNAATLILGKILSAYNNSATEYGGVIYSVDSPNTIQCNYSRAIPSSSQFLPTQYCFFQIERLGEVYAEHNTAGLDGSFMYGGLIGKCKVRENREREILDYYITNNNVLSPNTTSKLLSSDVYELCFCDSEQDYTYIRSRNVQVFRGQNLTVSLLALAQGEAVVSTTVTAVTLHSRLRASQNAQTLPEGCSNLTFNLYSAETHDQLILYPNGPCRDNGLARVTVSVTFLPCPEGFTQSGGSCDCEERLNAYKVQCTIEEGIRIVKMAWSNFWMSAVYTDNGSYGGLILYENCPAEYCKTQVVSLTLDDLDVQCDLNRSGVLCGQCAGNYSLMLGSSRCQICSNNYLALLLAFAAAGLALVAFLTFLKLTVATGTINSLILYANVVQVNKRLFFPLNQANILTVFIAWLNLDLGIETCFYDGLTAYAKTWLQFMFPVYVWILISSIILTARYSVLLSRVIGSDPIAVLATLLLMSYTKILRIIIEVYSFVDLDYPEDEKVRVWLKDGNVLYLSSKHLLLMVVTSLVLVLIFLPYTLLLLLGYKLYRFTGWKHFRWFSRIKPFLASYYAPYKYPMCFWTGFLLLVRCALYIIFSFNSLGGTRRSLLAIILMFTALAILGSGRIYENTVVNVVEMFVYFNLIVLSTATLAEYKWPAVAYTLVGTVFVIMVCTAVYQFHLLYLASTAAWLKVKVKLFPYFQHSGSPSRAEVPLPNLSHDPHKIVSKSVIDLREPLLET